MNQESHDEEDEERSVMGWFIVKRVPDASRSRSMLKASRNTE